MAIYLEDQLPGVKLNGLNTKKAVDFSGAPSVALPGGTTVAGAQTITSASASALVVGANGATNPVLKIDASVASVATGLLIQGQAAAGGVVLKALSSATDETLFIDAKGAGYIGLGVNAGSPVHIGGNVTINALSIITDTTTGLKIGTATNQKLGFYNVTPIVQPAASSDATGFVAGAGTTATSLSTWTGASGSSAYTVGGIVTALKALGLLAA